MPKKTDPVLLIIYIVLGIAITYFGAVLGAAMDLAVDETGKIDFLKIDINNTLFQNEMLIENVSDVNSNCFVVASLSAFIYFIFIVYKYINRLRLHRKGVEHGSARWANESEKKSLADKKKKLKEYVLRDETGKIIYKNSNEKPETVKIDNNIILTGEVFVSLNTRQHRKNLNVLIVGGSGAGKTRFFVKPNIMQLNTSYVVTDPKGEILQSTGKMLLEAGYDLNVFNLINMENSNNYNPFNYVYNFDGTLNESYVLKMINVLMVNTKKEGSGGGDQFWDDSATALLTAIAFLLIEEGKERDMNFAGVLKKLKLVQIDMNDASAKSELDKQFDSIAEKNPHSMAVSYYTDFKKAPPETAMSIVMSCNVRLQAFNIKMVADLTHTDTIKLNEIGDKKTALFIIIPVGDKTFNFLVAMLYTQLFDSLSNQANNKYADKGKQLPVHVRCILDEFANIGSIPNFENVIAFIRGMGISANVILQNVSQLKSMYEKTWESIKGNCDSFLFLGGQEATTLDDISKLLGKETIDLKSNNKTKGHKSSSTAENNSILGRELMTSDEINKMPEDKCICFVRSKNPFFGKKYEVTKHRNYKYLEDYSAENRFDYTKIKTLEPPLDPVTEEEKEVQYQENMFEPVDDDMQFGEVVTDDSDIEEINKNELKKVYSGDVIERTKGETMVTSKFVVSDGETSKEIEEIEYENDDIYNEEIKDDNFSDEGEEQGKIYFGDTAFEDNASKDLFTENSLQVYSESLKKYEYEVENENQIDLAYQVTSKNGKEISEIEKPPKISEEKEKTFYENSPFNDDIALPVTEEIGVITGESSLDYESGFYDSDSYE